MASDSLDFLFHPGSVAIVGASDDPSRIGGRPLRYLIEGGFAGPIYPVNPRRELTQGLATFPDVSSLPGPVDAAIVAVPTEHVLTVLEDCGAHGVRAVVLFNSGFAEMGEVGATEERRIGEIAASYGMRVLGPNCLGVYNAGIGFFATFTATFDFGLPKPGSVAIVSQSGAFGSHLGLMARRRGINLGLWVTTGNECDVSVSECIAWLAERPEVEVIAAYAEGIKDGDALIAACERVREQGKKLIFTKVGRSEIGSEAARSHTASLAGSDVVFDAVLSQHGILRAHDTEEMLDATYAASFGILPGNRCTGALTISGGGGVLMADAAAEFGLDLTPMPEKTQRVLKKIIPFCAPRNPVDITGQAFNDKEAIDIFVSRMFDDGGYASIVAFFTYVAAAPAMLDLIRDALRRARSNHPDRLMVLSMVGPAEVVQGYEGDGVPVFEDPVRGMRAVAALAKIAEGLSRRPSSTLKTKAETVTGEMMNGERLDEHQAKRLLTTWGIRCVEERVAVDAESAAAAARELGCPVAVKLLSPDIIHKSEAGGVQLGVEFPEAAAAAHRVIIESARDFDDDAEIRGTLVSRMLTDGVEVIIGARRDPTFGPVVMLGLGGILTEVLGDVAFRRAPIEPDEARRMVAELKGAKVLEGARGRVPCDIDALCEALAALSRFAYAHRHKVDSIDINPLMVMPAGTGVIALDALIVDDVS